ncbi:MAG: hypothetical protein DRO12_01365 [Thermoprotei archaeon]|nr:MAG: hypothetical protein DRO12_01365 [Thermoprotei archaeon]
MEILWTLAYVVLGFVAATFGSMAGLGGGFLMVPTLYYLSFSPQNAVAISKFMVGTNAVVSSFRYYRRLRIPLRLYAVVAPPMIACAYVGAYLTVVLPRVQLTLIIALILIVGSVRMLVSSRASKKSGSQSAKGSSISSTIIAFSGGALAGLVAGVSGLGGGIVAVPVFMYLLGLDPHTAVGLSMMCIMPSAIASIIRHTTDRTIIWSIAIPAAIGALGGGWVGPHLALRTPREKLRKYIALIILLASVRMIVESFITLF